MVYSQSFPQQIDREQAQQQLKALGYKAGDRVYLRAFYPSSDPRKAGDAGRKAEATNLDQLIERATEFQTEGRGVYLVVNGGGHTDKDVTETRAVFYEHDNLDKAAQIDLWKDLGLPEPTLQIDTGGKSIHSYWVFDEFVAVENWRSLQTELLEFADADRSLKNPSRVMRLAGARHSSGNQSLIASNSGKRYIYDELRAIVPTKELPEPSLFQASSTVKPLAADDIPDTYEDIAVPVPASVPLEECLAKRSRELLGGISEGGRNEAGAKLARDLIGTANYLRAIGQAFDGDPQQMLEDFAARCNPPLPKHEAETIWKSALQGSPTPACKPDGVKNCIKGWYWNNHIKTSRRFVDRQTDKPTHKNKLGMREAAQRAREILKDEPNEVSANIKLEEVRQKTSFSEYAWEHKIIKPLKRDMDAERFKLELLGLLQMEDPVERIRQIALLAPKYSMSAGSVKEAMSAMKQRTQAPIVESMGADELFDLESEAIDWLVPGLLPVGETVLLCALPKVGKTKLAVDLSFSVATGESRFLGQETKQGRVLLIMPDASLQSLKHELLKRGFRKEDAKNVRIIPRWSIDQLAALEAELEDFRPDLVVIDSLKRITVGKEISENSAEYADNIYALKDMLTRYRAAGVLVHHANKGADAVGVERARGSTAIVGACWGMWELARIPKQDPNNKKRLIVDPKCPKRIFTTSGLRGSEGTTLNIEFNAENNSWDFLGEVGIDEQEAQQQQTHRSRILNVLRANPLPLSGSEIMELLGVGREGRGSIYSELGRMETFRLISSKPAPGDKRYNLYSLPDFTPSCQTDTVTVAPKNSLPPPPPTPTVSVANYSSETITEHGLDNSQQNSQQIVSSKSECDSYQIAEIDSDKGVDPIVSSFSLSQGGGGVKCASDAKTVTPINEELAQPEPLAPPPAEAPLAPRTNQTDSSTVALDDPNFNTIPPEVETPIAPQEANAVAADYASRIRGACAPYSGRYSPATAACVENDLTNDIAARKITRNDIAVLLEPSELSLFENLVKISELGLVDLVRAVLLDKDPAEAVKARDELKKAVTEGIRRELLWQCIRESERDEFNALLGRSTPEHPPAPIAPSAPLTQHPTTEADAIPTPPRTPQPAPPSAPRPNAKIVKGSRVRYVGDAEEAHHYQCELVVDEIDKYGKIACKKSDGSFTTWLNPEDVTVIDAG
jgi:AAA domain